MTEQIAFIVILMLCVLVLIGMLGARLTQLERRVARLTSVEAKLDLLLQHEGLKYDPYKNVPAAVAEAVRDGRKIEAIKRYREATGVGLKEAKDAIEEIQRRGGLA
jgi:hypothetical protein